MLYMAGSNSSDEHKFAPMRAFNSTCKLKFINVFINNLPFIYRHKYSGPGLEQCWQQSLESNGFPLERLVRQRKSIGLEKV